MTDDPDLRFAASLVDYIFRRLAVEYMGPAERLDLGILTVSERMQPHCPALRKPSLSTSRCVPGWSRRLSCERGANFRRRHLFPPRSAASRPKLVLQPQSREGQEARYQ